MRETGVTLLPRRTLHAVGIKTEESVNNNEEPVIIPTWRAGYSCALIFQIVC